MAIQGEIPMINSFNLFRREADTSFGWNLILVNDDYCVPRNYEVELTELSNGEKVDSRIYPQLQQMFDDARAEGLTLLILFKFYSSSVTSIKSISYAFLS